MEVYAERFPDRGSDLTHLLGDPAIEAHFRRQRQNFFKAESLRLYARDSVPPETFERLQDDIYSGVVETAEDKHHSGWDRLTVVLTTVGQLDLQQHKLISVSEIDDRKGICHQLANNDRLTWVTRQ